MKWNVTLANWLGLAVLVLCCQMVAADDQKPEKLKAPVAESVGGCTPGTSTPCCQPVPAPRPPCVATQQILQCPPETRSIDKLFDAKAAEMMGALFGLMTDAVRSNAQVDQEQVQELIKILNETKSPYTLVATTVALAPLGDKAKVAVPAILRNAERLKVLESLGNPESRKGELANLLLESICTIQEGGCNGVFPQRGPQRVLTPPPPPPGFAPSPAAPFYGPAATCPGPVCPPPLVAPTPGPRQY
jgi:hypothetical protein